MFSIGIEFLLQKAPTYFKHSGLKVAFWRRRMAYSIYSGATSPLLNVTHVNYGKKKWLMRSLSDPNNYLINRDFDSFDTRFTSNPQNNKLGLSLMADMLYKITQFLTSLCIVLRLLMDPYGLRLNVKNNESVLCFWGR